MLFDYTFNLTIQHFTKHAVLLGALIQVICSCELMPKMNAFVNQSLFTEFPCEKVKANDQ